MPTRKCGPISPEDLPAMANPDADRLDAVVAEIVEHGHDDLPEGPSSPLGGEARPNPLITRSAAEIRRLAQRGEEIVNQRAAARGAKHAGTGC